MVGSRLRAVLGVTSLEQSKVRVQLEIHQILLICSYLPDVSSSRATILRLAMHSQRLRRTESSKCQHSSTSLAGTPI